MTYNPLREQVTASTQAVDPTEEIRRQLVAEINPLADCRKALEVRHGKVWDTEELGSDFDVLGFLAPFVVVQRRRDKVRGSLEFQHHPRFYFNFVPDRE